MSPEYGISIAEAFQGYLKTGDISLIDKYSARELRTAISLLSPYYNNNKLWYRELESRLQELTSVEASKRQKIKERILGAWKEKWSERFIVFVLGLAGGFFIAVM